MIFRRVEWRNAKIQLRCFSKTLVRPSGLQSKVLAENIVAYEGYVTPHNDPGGSGGCDEMEYSAYDPYAPADRCTTGPGNGSGGGSGIQYRPGDYTGGETVDWGTGVGNGGSSVCGEAAVVEYICIDVWDDEKGEWVEWSCGYATTC
jgi:hypothetical protein